MSALEADLRLALELLDLADPISLASFGRADLAVEMKADLSPVTLADREVERIVRARLAEARSDDAVLGEEFGGDRRPARRRWIIDPIDGTKRYVRGIPLFATLLALEEDGELVLGAVSAPAFGHRWWAARGNGAFADGRRIHVSGVSRVEDAHVSLASLDSWLEHGYQAQLTAVGQKAWSTTGYGDFWIHLLVAEGAADAALEPRAALWDLAPLKVIVEEAGGRFTDFDGLPTADGGNAVASNGLLHETMLDLLRSPVS